MDISAENRRNQAVPCGRLPRCQDIALPCQEREKKEFFSATDALMPEEGGAFTPPA